MSVVLSVFGKLLPRKLSGRNIGQYPEKSEESLDFMDLLFSKRIKIALKATLNMQNRCKEILFSSERKKSLAQTTQINNLLGSNS